MTNKMDFVKKEIETPLSFVKKHAQVLFIIIAILLLLSIEHFYYPLNNYTTSDTYKYFANIGGWNLTTLNGSQPSPSQKIEFNYLMIKEGGLTFLNTYGLFLQISLTVSSTLLGLYAVIFKDIIKEMQKRNATSLISKIIVFCFGLSLVVPFPLLVSSVYNTYYSYQAYLNLVRDTTTYLAMSSFTSYTAINGMLYPKDLIATLQFAYDNNTTSESYSVPEFGGKLFTKLQDINLFLDKQIIDYLKQAILIIVINLFIYWFYISTTIEKSQPSNSPENYQEDKNKE